MLADIRLQLSDSAHIGNRRAVLCEGHDIPIAHAKADIFRPVAARAWSGGRNYGT